MVEKHFLIAREFFVQPTEGPTKRRQHVAGVDQIEKVHESEVLALEKLNVQIAHEAADSQPKVIPNRDDALDVFAVALPKGLDEFRVFLPLLGVQPLLELVKDDK